MVALSANAADSYRVPAGGGSQYVSAFGLCATVTNNKTKDVLIPARTKLAILAFLSSGIPNVTVSYQACSCLSLKKSGQNTSGLYTIDPTNSGATFQAYCDMTTDGGGWTLIGRSVAGGTGVIGWRQANGSVTNDAATYSMDVRTKLIGFSEMLFGNYTSGKTWGANIYKKNFASTEISTYGGAMRVSSPSFLVAGTAADPEMLRYVGYTDNTESFHFRDCGPPGCSQATGYGLLNNGFNLFFTGVDAPKAGNLHGLQGMMFVR
ncbi:MAG: hypothetical protein EOP05_17520 [Proteobacteria bacterium]|nr:MAG: hypothetical protein EOP05_17520 [Pseudomonadota bacterium]